MVALQDLHRQIRTAIELGQLAWSRTACETILETCPENLETLLLLAELELETGAYRAAARRFQRVLAGDPEAYLACAGLAIAHEALRDPSAALHWHSRALDLNPSNPEIRHERDRLFEEAYPGRPLPEGLSEFSQARSLLDLRRYAEGIDGLRRALAQEPGRAEIKVGLAEILWICTRPQEASELCWELLNEIPQVVKAQALIACMAADDGDIEGGRVLLREAHAQDPSGRIAGHLLSQTALGDLASIPVEISVTPSEQPVREIFSGELPDWCHWMRRSIWRLLGLILPDEARPGGEADSPDPEQPDLQPGALADFLGGDLQGRRDLQSAIRPAERVLVSEQFQTVTRDELMQQFPLVAQAALDETPPAGESEPAEPPQATQGTPLRHEAAPADHDEQGPLASIGESSPLDPAVPGQATPPQRASEAIDPDATEIIDQPGWVRLRNDLRKGRKRHD